MACRTVSWPLSLVAEVLSRTLPAVSLPAWQYTFCWPPRSASDLRVGMLLASLHRLSGSVLSHAGFLQAWLAGGLREQVLACVGALLEELEPDQRCTILLTGKQYCPPLTQLLPSMCELCLAVF